MRLIPRTRPRVKRTPLLLSLFLAAGLAGGCREKTGALTPSEQQRIDSEGLVRRADDLIFRYTHDAGRRDAGWEDRKASIIVTKQSVIIHKNEKLGLEITPRTRRFVQVRRDGNRVRISAGGGGAAESWSFVPPDDAAGWVTDIRAVVSAAAAGGKQE
ncbi:MAG TPA: hypothetical protein VFN08_01930 [Gemmatimonadales bacterium]|nr:hypothetical protein [Gemmatimonadales bacterium]